MSQPITIALDAMGGDQGPEMVLEGADQARLRYPGTRFLLFGEQAKLNALLDRNAELAAVSTVHHTDIAVGSDEKPSVALRQGRASSMRLAIDAVRDGAASGIVSAGNTGALMAMAKLVLKTLPGIHRPALATIFPTKRGETVVLDLGANAECTAENLVQFAVLGEVFARIAIGVVKPTVGLLNVGIEITKGNETVRNAAKLLEAGNLPIVFHGFIEGDDITAGTVDVAVTDGFTGNVALKAAEGTARLIADYLRTAFEQSLMARLGYMLARPALTAVRARVDPRHYNGAVFLGLNGIAVKSHGGTDALGFSNAIGVAVDLAAQGFNDKVIAELNQWHADHVASERATAV